MNRLNRSISVFALILVLTLSIKANAEENRYTGFGGYLYYNFAGDMDVEFEDSSVTYGSNGALGLGVRYAHTLWRDLGISGGLAYEFERSVDLEGLSDDGTYSIFLFDLNAHYQIYWGIYAFAGINYSLPTADFPGNADMTGGIGMQIGAGYVILPYLTADIAYRTSNFTVDSGDEESDSARLWGVLLRVTGQYDFFGGNNDSY